MLYSWNDRAEYTRYQTNEALDNIERKTGRLPDDVRDVVISELSGTIRTTILDVAEEMRR